MGISIDDLNNIHMDVLREIGNIGAGNAATALASMLNKRVDMAVPKVKILQFCEVTDIIPAEELVIGILLNVEGDLKATIMFLLSIEAARNLVNLLMGFPIGNDGEFSELDQSALKEIGNILTGSYLSALSSLTNLTLIPSVPDMAIDMAGAIISVPAIEFGKVGDTVLYIETEFTEGSSRVAGDFFLVPDVESFDTLLETLGVVIDD